MMTWITFTHHLPTRSKISRAKDRAKQLKLIAAAAKKFEKTIKRYGKNNPAF